MFNIFSSEDYLILRCWKTNFNFFLLMTVEGQVTVLPDKPPSKIYSGGINCGGGGEILLTELLYSDLWECFLPSSGENPIGRSFRSQIGRFIFVQPPCPYRY